MITEYFPGIIGYSNLLDDPMQYILSIEKDISEEKYSWIDMLTGSEQESPSLYPTKRRGKNIGLSICASNSSKAEEFKQSLNNKTRQSIEEYSKRYGYWDLVQEGWVLLKYEQDDFFITHTDSSRKYPRQVSAVYYVNDNYTGGELNFPYLSLTIKPKSNELIVFPSTNMFSHQAEKIVSGTKYSLANWFN